MPHAKAAKAAKDAKEEKEEWKTEENISRMPFTSLPLRP
jgi:hypothetical protein